MERFGHSDARSTAVLRTLNRVNSRPGWCDPYISADQIKSDDHLSADDKVRPHVGESARSGSGISI